MKVGLVGFGMAAERFHAPLISAEPGLTLSHVVERHQRRGEQLYPHLTTLTDSRQLWDSEVDVVVILTPNATHYRLAKEALEAGKHVVVDKPLAVSSREVEDLISVAGRANRILTAFHNRRWDSGFLTLRQLLEQDALGELHRYECRWERFRPAPKGGWREEDGSGTGILFDLGSHLIDQALQLFGPPRAMLCKLRVQRPGTTAVDCFDWWCDYGFMLATLSSNCLTAAPTFHHQLLGLRGTFTQRGLDPQEAALQAGLRPGGPHWGREPEERWGELERLDEGRLVRQKVPAVAGDYTHFYRNLVAALRGEAELEVKAEQARDVVRAIELAIESDRQGRWIPWS